ncbi:7541_t:CDS:2 [Cetraspora pellucida]|uniref:7541_t:CDS:1 n=1 Tax=Cetraspora pellucida TaxID=1433469 RepID=A0A9N9E8B4_9GLOM|nr:7541_t:CDS:2 [Cetraspora pellucida]
MGSKQSTPAEMVIYNEPPIRFSHGLVNKLQQELQKERLRKTQPTVDNATEPILPEDIENIVQTRVERELNRIRERDEEIQRRIEVELVKRRAFIDDHGLNAVVTEQDIEELILRVERKYENKIPTELIEQQRAIISCYKNNSTHTLDCWEEVQQFKRKVQDAIQEYVISN